MQENGQDIHRIDAMLYPGVIDVLAEASSGRVVRCEDLIDPLGADRRWAHNAEGRLTRASCWLHVLCWIRQVLSKQRAICNQRRPRLRRGEHVSPAH